MIQTNNTILFKNLILTPNQTYFFKSTLLQKKGRSL